MEMEERRDDVEADGDELLEERLGVEAVDGVGEEFRDDIVDAVFVDEALLAELPEAALVVLWMVCAEVLRVVRAVVLREELRRRLLGRSIMIS